MKGWVAKKGADLWTGLFQMIFSGLVMNEAFDLEIGTPHNPGSGFMILGAAALLGILAVHQFIRSLLSQENKTEQAPEKIHLWRIIAVIVANIIYIAILEPVGYLLCTFLLLCLLFQINEKGKWVWAVGGAALTSFVSYAIFSRLLQLNLPKGLIPFF
jgi:putative tricarboxylic transport membrane protein